ncbi:hypothetical protein ILYODFUR_005787 [Ilyodon furcidens]|uniref:Uncharacterized protein n=1 Tax=Ilyodon furcidens TaxID=33524 RepID=A0ABV0UFI0_9TELE
MSISTAVALPGSHDRILMGLFSYVSSISHFLPNCPPPLHAISQLTHHRSLQDKKRKSLAERSHLAHCQLSSSPHGNAEFRC